MVTIRDELIADLKRDEGLRLKAYKDTVGIWTIGYGHTGSDVKSGTVWTKAQAEAALREDVKEHAETLVKKLPWILKLNPVRQDVLFNMAFNLGVSGLLGFRTTLSLIKAGAYGTASTQMLVSKWAKQVGNRALRLSVLMDRGTR